MLYKNYLEHLDHCPFCAPKDRVIGDSATAFLTFAKAPYHKHHLLVIPKRHVETFFDLTRDELVGIDGLLRTAVEIMRKLGYESSTIVVREGNASGRTIAHLHYHIIPETRIGDLDHLGNERKIMTSDEIEKTVSDVVAKL